MQPFGLLRCRRRGLVVLPACASIVLVLIVPSALISGCSAQDSTVTVRGTVIDSATRKPLPGATVYVDRQPLMPSKPNARFDIERDKRGSQQITDARGSFVIRGLGMNSHRFNIAKPGYTSATDPEDHSSYEVRTGPGMGDLRFVLAPSAQLSGRVTSNIGLPVTNVWLALYAARVQDGSTVWSQVRLESSGADGSFIFRDLHAGSYVVVSDWVFDNDPNPPHGSNCGGSRGFMPQAGYAPEATPGVHDFSAANPIHLDAGQRSVANLQLQHQLFHPVRWNHGEERSTLGFDTLRDRNGRDIRIGYPNCKRSMPETIEPLIRGNFSFGGSGVETMNLPDGDYTFTVRDGFSKNEGIGKFMSSWLGTYARIHVEGKPLTLSYPSKPARPEPSVKIHIHFDITPDRVRCSGVTSSASTANSSDDGRPSWHYIWLTPVASLPTEERHPIQLDLARDNSPQFHLLPAGKYWVHAVELTNTGEMGDQPNTYIASITAGGADMSREPLVVAPDGTAPPLEITARNHCGILHMNYRPANPNQETYGIVRTFYGLLIPQFAAFENVHSFMFEPGQPQEISVGNLTPGHYKFYVANRDRGIAFREPRNIPADLGPGQDLWLKAGEEVNITVTEPAAEE